MTIPEFRLFLRKWSDSVFFLPVPNLAFCTSAGIALGTVLLTKGGPDVLILWLFGAILGGYTLYGARPAGKKHISGPVAAWGLLGGAFLLSFAGFSFNVSFFLFVLSVCAFSCSFSLALKLLPAVGVMLVLIPGHAFFKMLFSYPLRLTATTLTGFFLTLFGVPVEYQGTDISLGGTSIAITAACSGIDQLETMLLLGYLLVLVMHGAFWTRLMHFMLIVPALVVSNVIRLFATLLLYRVIGERVFENTLHSLFGCLTVAAAFVLLYLGGLLFDRRVPGKEPETPADFESRNISSSDAESGAGAGTGKEGGK